MDLTELTLEELKAHYDEVRAELELRRQKDYITSQIDRLNNQYLNADHIVSGDEWRQPTGAHDAYPRYWRVTKDGKTWESTTPGNVWQPGVSGWREVTDSGGTETPPEFLQPTGAHDTYQTGERVTFEGAVYESLIDNNAYSPTDYPQGWELIE